MHVTERLFGKYRGHDILPNLSSWDARVTRAIKRGKFTESEVRMAWAWATCQVGELKRLGYAIPMLDVPLDEDMEKLGIRFSFAVRTNQPRLAQDTAELIRAIAPLPPIEGPKELGVVGEQQKEEQYVGVGQDR